jgi:2-C-methyl-D-erythritol 4-phosphate cytidylyltransferase
MGQFAVILPAAGRSSRFGDPKQKKIYAELDGRAVWLRALDPFLTHGEVEQIIVAIAPEDREMFDRRYRDKVVFLNLDVIDGGANRADTVQRALERVRPVCQYVAIHDAARPCLTEAMVTAVFAAGREHGAALLAVPASDTVKRASDGRFTTETISRHELFLAQTPQVFRRDWLDEAYAQRTTNQTESTDDTQLVEALGHRCAIVPGSILNVKITNQEDMRLAGAILRVQAKPHGESCGHPFADEAAIWADLPKLKASDLFDS